MNDLRISTDGNATTRTIWMTVIVAASVGLSLFFACATPFAALATLAALNIDRRDTANVVFLAWLANQVIGYGFMGYPWTWDSLAWGLAIGAGAGVAVLTAMALVPRRPAAFAISLPFVAAFAAYELTLYVAAFVLPSEASAFSGGVVWHLFVVNGVALIGLAIVQHLAVLAAPLVRPAQAPVMAPALR